MFVAVESRDNADTAAIADTAATTSASDDARRALSQYKLDLVPLQPSRADVSAREVALQTLLLASQAKPESSPANHAIITQRNLQQLAPMLTKIAGQSEWDAAIVQNAQAITRTQA